jgi:hypothetical protein
VHTLREENYSVRLTLARSAEPERTRRSNTMAVEDGDDNDNTDVTTTTTTTTTGFYLVETKVPPTLLTLPLSPSMTAAVRAPRLSS